VGVCDQDGAGVVVAGDEDLTGILRGVSASEDGIDVGDLGGLVMRALSAVDGAIQMEGPRLSGPCNLPCLWNPIRSSAQPIRSSTGTKTPMRTFPDYQTAADACTKNDLSPKLCVTTRREMVPVKAPTSP
jgi:hypothetical protein